jgi:hypothetical protein
VRTVIALIFTLFTCNAVGLENIVTLHSTGIGDNNSPILSGLTDVNWKLPNFSTDAFVVDPQTTVIGNGPYEPGKWIDPSILPIPAKWISFDSNPFNVNPYLGTYLFESEFDLSDYKIETANISVNWAATGRTYVILNGYMATYNLEMQDLQLYNVDNRMLVQGVNKIQFFVHNNYNISSSWGIGLLASFKGVAQPVPEPSTIICAIISSPILLLIIKKGNHKNVYE